MRNLLGWGQSHFKGGSACKTLEMELQYIIRMAQIASGRVLFMSTDVFKVCVRVLHQSFPSIAQCDLFLRTKLLHYPFEIHDTLFFPPILLPSAFCICSTLYK